MRFTFKSFRQYYEEMTKSFYKNSYYLMINTLLSSVLGVVFWSIATRIYSTEDIGYTVTLISIITLISLASNLGFSSSLVKYLPSSDGLSYQSIINTCFTISGCISIVLSIIILILVYVFYPSMKFILENFTFIFVFTIASLFMSLNTLLLSVFIGKRVSKFELLKNSVMSISRLIFLVLFSSFGLLGIFSSFGLSMVISFLFAITLLLPRIHPEYSLIPKISKNVIKNLKQYSAGNYIADFFMTAPGFVLPFIITNNLNADNTAYFYIAWTVAGIIMIIPISISNSFFAEASYDSKNINSIMIKSLRFSLLLVLISILIIVLVGDKLLLVFGKNYSTNANNILLLLLSISCIPYTFNRMYITAKKVENEISTVIIVTIITAIFSLGFVYLLINSMGLLGIGVGWILGQTVILMGTLLKSRKYFYADFDNIKVF